MIVWKKTRYYRSGHRGEKEQDTVNQEAVRRRAKRERFIRILFDDLQVVRP